MKLCIMNYALCIMHYELTRLFLNYIKNRKKIVFYVTKFVYDSFYYRKDSTFARHWSKK